MGLRVKYLLTASSVIPWLSSPEGTGVAVVEDLVDEETGEPRGFLAAGLPLSDLPGTANWLAGLFFDLAGKKL